MAQHGEEDRIIKELAETRTDIVGEIQANRKCSCPCNKMLRR